jgi:UDP-glucose 4-epimerase
VNGLIALAGEPRAVGQVFNIGNTEEISIVQLAQRVKTMAGSSSDVVLIPYAQAYEAGFEDMPRRVPDLSKIREYVGYTPTIGLEEILSRVIDHTRATLEPVSSRAEASRRR